MSSIFARRERAAGFMLLALSIVVLFTPRFQIAGQPISAFLVTCPWICAAILLLAGDSAVRPMPVLTRWAAAILFVMGLASPFAANLIDQSFGV